MSCSDSESSPSSASSGLTTASPTPIPSLLGDECRAKIEEPEQKKDLPPCSHVSRSVNLTPSVRAKVLNPSRWSCRGCPTSADVWACLQCGHIGCGQEVKSHAAAHFKKTKHPIAMDINGQKSCVCFECNRRVLEKGEHAAVEELRKDLTRCQEDAAHSSSASGTDADEPQKDGDDVAGKRKERVEGTRADADDAEKEQPVHKKGCLLRSRSVWQLTKEQFMHQDMRATANKHAELKVLSHAFAAWRSAAREAAAEKKREGGRKTPTPQPPSTTPTPKPSDPPKALRRARTRQLVPGRTGLRNLGNTCFMNSIIQAVSSIFEFRDYFLRMAWVQQQREAMIRNRLKQQVRGQIAAAAAAAAVAAAASSGVTESLPTLPVVSRRMTQDCLDAVRQRGRNDKEPISICTQLHELLRVLWSGKWAVVTPFALLESVWRLVPRFRGYQQQDAQEFLCSLFDRVQNEIATPPSSAPTPVPTPPAAATSAASTTNTVISDTFQGSLLSRVTCTRCKRGSERAEPFLDLSLNIPQIETKKKAPKRKQKNPPRGAAKKKRAKHGKKDDETDEEETEKEEETTDEEEEEDPEVTLEDCLKSFTAPEFLDANTWECEHCKKKVRAKKQLWIRTPPRVICVVLKRFSWRADGTCAKVTMPVSFPSTLDIGKYCTAPPSESTSPPRGKKLATATTATATVAPEISLEYRLRAVVVHQGLRLSSGHYTAYCADGDSSWVHFNDSFVTPVEEADVLESGKKAGYIFFYRCQNPEGIPIPDSPVEEERTDEEEEEEKTDKEEEEEKEEPKQQQPMIPKPRGALTNRRRLRSDDDPAARIRAGNTGKERKLDFPDPERIRHHKKQ